MCQVPDQFIGPFNPNFHSFLYGDYEYFAWFATPHNQRTMQMFKRVLRWKGLTRGIGRIGGIDNIWAGWQANDDFANFDNDRRLVTRVFLLHLREPTEYPILDKWVWCAYRTLSGEIDQNGRRIVNTPTNWERHYEGYRAFFNVRYGEHPQIDGVDEEIIKKRILDRALWEYGRIPLQNG